MNEEKKSKSTPVPRTCRGCGAELSPSNVAFCMSKCAKEYYTRNL